MPRRRTRFARLTCIVLAVAPGIPDPLEGKIADHWEDFPPLPTPRQEVGVAALDGSIYVIGGILANRTATGLVERFDTAELAWHPAPPLPDGARLHHIGAAAAAGSVFAVGGLDGSFRGVQSVFRLDLPAGEWERVADLPWPRGAMGVAASASDRLYVAGGQDGSQTFATAAVYLAEEDRWEDLPPMPTARNHLAAVAGEGLFYAAGGRASQLTGAFEVYGSVEDRWSTLPSLPTPRAGIAAALVGEEIFVFGGEGNRSAPSGVFPQTESYSIRGARWFPRLEMAHPRHGIGAAAVGDLIYIPGGSPVEGFGVTGVHDAFAPGTPPWAIGFHFRRGDADTDGLLRISDPIRIVLFLFTGGAELPCRDAADADDDGILNITDAVFIATYLFLGTAPPPPPGPEVPGPDPTDDDLDCAEYPVR